MTGAFRQAQPNEREIIRALLLNADLPTETVEGGPTEFFVGLRNGRIVSVAGLEFYGKDALLRSVVVLPEFRRTGLGTLLIDYMLTIAKTRSIERLFLLTETARGFFEKRGFTVIQRSAVDNEALKGSSEFSSACPQSAVCMELDVRLTDECNALNR